MCSRGKEYAVTEFQKVTRELARLADELANDPDQHQGELWKDFCTKEQEFRSLFECATVLLDNGLPGRIPGTGLHNWEIH